MNSQSPAKPSAPANDYLWSLIIFVVALVVRTLHLLQIRTAPFFPLKIGDAESYDAWGKALAAGDWIGSGVFYQAPLYPYFLGSIYRLLGDDIVTVRKCQAVIGSLSCVLLAHAAWNLFSRRAGIAAGLMLALYAPVIFLEGLLQKSVLDVFFVCFTLWVLSRLASRPNVWSCLAAGMGLGAFVLTRENAAVLIPPVLISLLVQRWDPDLWPRRWHVRRLAWAAALVLGIAAALLPVALRNYLVGGELHLTTSQFGPNLYIGNNPSADGTYRPLRYGRGHARYERDDARQLAEEMTGRPLTSGEVSDYYIERTLCYIAEQPTDWLLLLARKAVLTLNAVEITDSEDQYTHAQHSLPLRILGNATHLGILVPLAILGVWTTWQDRNRLWLFYALPIVFAGSTVLFFVFARYRLPLAPLLMLFASAGVVQLSRFVHKCSRRKQLMVIASFLAVALFCNWRVVSVAPMRATTLNNIGNALARGGRLPEAIEQYQRALRLQYDQPLVHNNLGAVLMHQGRLEEAVSHYRKALRINPEYRTAQSNLERTLERMKTENAPPD